MLPTLFPKKEYQHTSCNSISFTTTISRDSNTTIISDCPTRKITLRKPTAVINSTLTCPTKIAPELLTISLLLLILILILIL